MTRTEYIQNRQRIISNNRSRRMKGLPVDPTPPALKPIYGYELTDAEGDYAGYTLSIDEARASGHAMKRTPAIMTGHFPV